MPKQKKTNAARILDEKKIEYTLIEYAVDEEHLDAVHVAKEVGLPPEQVFKTLVVRGDKTGPVFAVIPGSCQSKRQQKGRDGSFKRSAAADRIYPRRMLSAWREKELPRLP